MDGANELVKGELLLIVAREIDVSLLLRKVGTSAVPTCLMIGITLLESISRMRSDVMIIFSYPTPPFPELAFSTYFVVQTIKTRISRPETPFHEGRQVISGTEVPLVQTSVDTASAESCGEILNPLLVLHAVVGERNKGVWNRHGFFHDA